MSDDSISRRAAIKAVSKACFELRGVFGRCEDALKALPSVEPERKTGQWVNDGKGFYKCTSCGEPWPHWWAVVVSPDRMCKELRYCPKCGARMERSEE